jgi:hypothetical protein
MEYVYQLKCMEYPLQYDGQPRHTLKIQFKEQIQNKNKQNSRYSQHILKTGHTYGTINKTLNILHTEK